MKKQSKSMIYLSVLLLAIMVFFMFLLNQFLTNDHAPAEDKQRVTTEPKTAVPKEEQKPASQTEKETDEKAKTNENQGGYVGDWFKQSGSSESEEIPVSSENEAPNQEETEKTNEETTDRGSNETTENTIENQSSKEVVEEQPVEAPLPPVKPEQPSVSSK
ncbi:hypothetical protein AWH48_11310 [Domibacillus aminovorans]|uniref:DUF1510 domain-containing protein n=1 Tax=Domibacillus aminovorans TaxID=29332 RepID=A0A177KKE4_9BACI|nr:hypothetical protein [Domibacillus aminovorans]OAH53852.1 hypothetical protein AWH48_11310 [Domibacillus aminovorans]